MSRFPKSSRILRRNEFERILRQGKRRSGKWLVIEYRVLPHLPVAKAKLGITVTKKYGKAHDRNRFKRLVRESFRALPPDWLVACEIVVRPRGAVALVEKPLSCQDVYNDLKELLIAHGLFKPSGETKS